MGYRKRNHLGEFIEFKHSGKPFCIEISEAIEGHEYQQLVYSNLTQRFILEEAGRRGGKTYCNAVKAFQNIYIDLIEILEETQKAPDKKPFKQQTQKPGFNKKRKKNKARLLYWFVAPDYSIAETMRDTFLDVVPEELIQNITNNRTDPIWLYPDIKIEFKSGENPNKLVSKGLNGIWITETARLKSSAWNDNLRPGLSDRNGWLLSDTTPLGMNWYVRDIADLADKALDSYDDEYIIYTWFTKHNTMLPGIEKEVERARKTMPEKDFKRNYEASRDAYRGQIFDEFNQSIHMIPFEHNPERYKVIIAGQDWGYTHRGVCVIVGITHSGKIDIIDEIVRTKTNVVKPTADYSGETWVGLVKEASQKYQFKSRSGRLSGFDVVYCGPDEPEHIDDYNMNNITARKAENAVKPGIKYVQSLLKVNEGSSAVRIHPRCENLKQNLQTQKWVSDKEGEESEVPEKGSGENDFDSNDALRYALYSVKGIWLNDTE